MSDVALIPDGMAPDVLEHARHIAWAEVSEARARSNRLEIAAFRHPGHPSYIAKETEQLEMILVYTKLVDQDVKTALLHRATAARLLR